MLSGNDVIVRAIGAAIVEPPVTNFEFVEWSEAGETELIEAIDIGVMPLDDSPFFAINAAKSSFGTWPAAGRSGVARGRGRRAKVEAEYSVQAFDAKVAEIFAGRRSDYEASRHCRHSVMASVRHRVALPATAPSRVRHSGGQIVVVDDSASPLK